MDKKKIKLSKPDEVEWLSRYIESGFHEEVLNECKILYKKADTKTPVHLYALEALCNFGTYHGLDCSWIHTAYESKLDKKYQTHQKDYYLGAFLVALENHGCSFEQIKIAIPKWTGISDDTLVTARRLYKNNNSFSKASFGPTYLQLQMASAVNNCFKPPFPTNSEIAFKAHQKLLESFQNEGLESQQPPFNPKLLTKRLSALKGV